MEQVQRFQQPSDAKPAKRYYCTVIINVCSRDGYRKCFAGDQSRALTTYLRVSSRSLGSPASLTHLPIGLGHFDSARSRFLGTGDLRRRGAAGRARLCLNFALPEVHGGRCPEPDTVKIPLAYPVARRDQEWTQFVNTWIELKRRDGTIDALYGHWILGKHADKREPRWSVIRNLLSPLGGLEATAYRSAPADFDQALIDSRESTTFQVAISSELVLCAATIG